ncbi:MAG: ABC transporter ATP-binding protein [Planctomycetes bacterium]|nr:ABC transporter ATP-binding protein [Planctomycetota bacterium]MBL7186747.1 ABC transporter ATP-binding protein [Phycisphaerae bacterium]
MTLRAENIIFSYRYGRLVLQGITLEIRPGTVTAMFGPNGSGKSTLLRCMNGTLEPQSGDVTVNGREIHSMSRQEIARQIAVVPQDSPADVPLTASEMVMLGRFAHWDIWGQEMPEDRTIVQESLARLNATALAERSFGCISGGERQRVVLARALAQQAPIMLFDEPNTHLDISHQIELYRLVRELADEGKAILMACHDIFVTPMFVDNAVLMHSGGIHAAGPAAAVLTPDNVEAVFGASIEISWQKDFSFSAIFT